MLPKMINRFLGLLRSGSITGKTQRQEALLRLSADLAAVMDEGQISRRVVSGLHATLGYDYLALFLLDETSGNRVLSANVGFDQMVPFLPPGQGLSERPLLDQKLHYSPDVTTESNYVRGVGGSEVDVPIWINGKVQGVLVAESRRKDNFGSDDFEVLTAAAQQASLAFEKARLLASERQRADELDALRATMAEITAELKLSALLQAIVERAADLLAVSGGELGLYDNNSHEIEIVVSHNLGKDYVGSRHDLGEGAMGRVVKTGQPLIIEDYQEWEGALPDYPNIHATMAVPLKVGKRIVGVFTSVSTEKGRKFSPADLHLLNLFGQQASIAIENARLFEQARVEIREREKYEAEIIRQKEYFEALFVNNPVAVVTADLEGTIVSWNPSAEKLFHYTQEEVIGKNLDDVVAKNVTIYEEAKGYSSEVIEKGRVQAIVKRTRKDGTLVDMELLALPVIVGGERVGFIAIYVDITDLQNARRASEAANQAKSIFLANMNHELRTPLNAILGFAQLMEGDANLTPTQQEYLEIINQSGEHLLALINDVLEMSKIEAGQVTLREKPFDLHLMLAGLEDMFRIRAQEKELDLRFFVDSNFPQFVVTDERRLRQVLLNLLGNAVKFTQLGEVALRAWRGEPTEQNGKVHLHFAIEDSGLGIQEDELLEVFEPFIQASHQKPHHEGTGLGLSISSQLVRLLGGEISVSSKLNKGSVFAFEIGARLADSTQLAEEHQVRKPVSLSPGQPRYRVLIAEDHEPSRRLLEGLLAPVGFEVREARNGKEAVEIWKDWNPHLIWMDMRMPVMNGYQATREIKAGQAGIHEGGGESPKTVVIALTASAYEEDRQKIFDAGCDDIVRKPIQRETIFEVLSRHLGVKFLYETRPVEGVSTRDKMGLMRLSDQQSIASLRALPEGQVTELRRATTAADIERINRSIDQIREEDRALGELLAELAYHFEYEKILTLTGMVGNEP